MLFTWGQRKWHNTAIKFCLHNGQVTLKGTLDLWIVFYIAYLLLVEICEGDTPPSRPLRWAGQESIPRNRFRQPMEPGGPVRRIPARARICKRLGAQESIPPAYVAWPAGQSNRVVITARQAGNRLLGSLKRLQIRALGVQWKMNNDDRKAFVLPAAYSLDLTNSSLGNAWSSLSNWRGTMYLPWSNVS